MYSYHYSAIYLHIVILKLKKLFLYKSIYKCRVSKLDYLYKCNVQALSVNRTVDIDYSVFVIYLHVKTVTTVIVVMLYARHNVA